MTNKTDELVEQTIRAVVERNNIEIKEGDIEALRKAYMKHGDIDLAVDNEGDVLSDIMEGEELDVIAGELNRNFGSQSHNVPFQVFVVKINGRSYDTFIDSFGNQRFVGNRVVERLMKETQKRFIAGLIAPDKYDENEKLVEKEELFNIGDLGELYIQNEFTFEEYLDFYALLGYNLSSLKMLPEFEKIAIENSYVKL